MVVSQSIIMYYPLNRIAQAYARRMLKEVVRENEPLFHLIGNCIL